jgi:hypothetical protein
LAIDGFDGDTEMDVSVAGVTFMTVEPDTPPNEALIVDIPVDNADARPFDPAALEIVATLVLDELNVTFEVRFCVVLFE